jgi:quercetin dioxygenase-like cupin family protein
LNAHARDSAGRAHAEHAHDNDHENFVLEGTDEVLFDGDYHPAGRPGDVVFVPPGATHQYRNASDGPFRFMCGVPVSMITGT